MKLKKIHDLAFSSQGPIICATLVNADEWVMLYSNAIVARFKVNDASAKGLFDVKNNGFTYIDGGFDLSAPSTIYVMDSIVVIVNDYKTHGFVYYPGKYPPIRLQRNDNEARITPYPITLYKDEKNVPHLIYSVDWNHLQIMNLDTRQILTAVKSLISENEEKRHTENYEEHLEDVKLPWPTPYDYWYGQLIMSPNNKQFLSKGWTWGSADYYNIYDLNDFITNPKIRYKNIGLWEHNNRVACWVDDNTVVVNYIPSQEDIEEYGKDTPAELHFYDIMQDKPAITRKVTFNTFGGDFRELYYSNKLSSFVAIGKKKGLAVCNVNGEIVFTDEEFNPCSFLPEQDLFLSLNDNSIIVHQLINNE